MSFIRRLLAIKEQKPIDRMDVNFEAIRGDLIKALIEKMTLNPCFRDSEEKFTLLNGFFNTPVQDRLDGHIYLGGPSIPMIAVMGQSSGQVIFFALKFLMPNLDV